MTERAAALRVLAEALPAGTAIPVPRELVLELTAPDTPAGGEPPADRLLTAEEVAERLQLSVAVVYRKAKHWPFTRRLGRRVLRFSEAGLTRWLARRP